MASSGGSSSLVSSRSVGSLRASDGVLSHMVPKNANLAANRQAVHHELMETHAYNAEVRRRLEETKREVRDIRAVERKLRWNLERQDKKENVVTARNQDSELRDWRWRQRSGMKQYVEQKASRARAADLRDSRNFQTFKREAKVAQKQEEMHHNAHKHQQDVGHAAQQAEIAQEQREKDHEVKLAKCESVLFQKEAKVRLEIESKIHDDQERVFEQTLEMNEIARQMCAHRSNLLESLELTKAAAKSAPRSARTGCGRGLRRS